MGSLEEIDDNNFVIKIRIIDIKSEYFNEELYHGRYSWNLKSTNADDQRVYSLKWAGPNNNTLLNIDASVTFDFCKQDGAKGITISIDTSFNMDKPECEWKVPTGADFDAVYTDVEVRVRINSVSGLQREPRYSNFEEDKLSDVALVVEGRKLFVNKAVLATFSPVFRAMFFSGFRESTDKEVVIKDVKYDDFLDFLQVMHTTYSYIYEESVENLLVLADRYDVEVVREKCDKYLLSTDDDFADYNKLQIAVTYKLPNLYNKCKDAIDKKEELERNKSYDPCQKPIQTTSFKVEKSNVANPPIARLEFDKDNELSDVVLIVEGKKLFVNKAVLATFSPVFREMFFPESKPSIDTVVIINDVKYDDFEQFLQLIHTTSPTITDNNIGSILTLGDRYKVDVVMEKCENFLLSAICYSVDDMLRLAKIYSFPKVHEKYKELVDIVYFNPEVESCYITSI